MSPPGNSYSPGRTSPEKALQKIKHFCGYQERSHAEVKQKLYSLGLFKQEAELLVTRLIEEEYLNEERYAIRFAAGKSRLKGWGKVKIRYELKRKGVSDFYIAKALNFLNEKEYEADFRRIAEKKWIALRSEKNIFTKKNKWQQFLLQRGFDHAIMKTWTSPEEKEAGSTD